MPHHRPLPAAALLLLLAAAAPAPHATAPAPAMAAASGTTVALQAQPGTPLDHTARTLMADDLAAARSRGDQPLLLLGRAPLGGPQPALFVQMQSTQECGSAGCSTAVYSWEKGAWQRVLDGTTGRLTVSTKKTRGRNDLISEDDHFVWTGAAYQSLQPAPAIDLRPHPRKH